jgi:hypothetical protein
MLNSVRVSLKYDRLPELEQHEANDFMSLTDK